MTSSRCPQIRGPSCELQSSLLSFELSLTRFSWHGRPAPCPLARPTTPPLPRPRDQSTPPRAYSQCGPPGVLIGSIKLSVRARWEVKEKTGLGSDGRRWLLRVETGAGTRESPTPWSPPSQSDSRRSTRPTQQARFTRPAEEQRRCVLDQHIWSELTI